MGSLYRIFLKNVKKNPNQTLIYNLKNKYDGNFCLRKLIFLRKIIRFNKLNTIGIKSPNSVDWILWYLAADSYDKKIILINNDIQKKNVNKILKKYKIDYLAENIPSKLKLNVKIFHDNSSNRQDILFTSGSTDLPKGAIISESSYLHVAKILLKKLKQNSKDIELLSMPFNHSFGLVRLRCCLLAGSRILVTDGLKNFPVIFKFSQENNLTGLSLVPSGLALIKTLLRNKAKLFTKKLRYFEIGSSFINKDTRIWLKKNFSKTRIIHHYGMTEASRSFIIERGQKDNLRDRSNKIGQIILGCKYGLINRNKKSGELILKGKNLFEGYQDDHQNKSKFFRGWFRTGDIVEKKGNDLYITGRVDNQFNIGGNKIQAEMMEDLIESVIQVKKCVCFTLPDEIFGYRLGLIIEKAHNISKEKLIKLIYKKLDKLPDFYFPKKIFFKKVLLTKNGKKIRNL